MLKVSPLLIIADRKATVLILLILGESILGLPNPAPQNGVDSQGHVKRLVESSNEPRSDFVFSCILFPNAPWCPSTQINVNETILNPAKPLTKRHALPPLE